MSNTNLWPVAGPSWSAIPTPRDTYPFVLTLISGIYNLDLNPADFPLLEDGTPDGDAIYAVISQWMSNADAPEVEPGFFDVALRWRFYPAPTPFPTSEEGAPITLPATLYGEVHGIADVCGALGITQPAD